MGWKMRGRSSKNRTGKPITAISTDPRLQRAYAQTDLNAARADVIKIKTQREPRFSSAC
jgi:hypothetical protein